VWTTLLVKAAVAYGVRLRLATCAPVGAAQCCARVGKAFCAATPLRMLGACSYTLGVAQRINVLLQCLGLSGHCVLGRGTNLTYHAC
jgi:hypothetical protein